MRKDRRGQRDGENSKWKLVEELCQIEPASRAQCHRIANPVAEQLEMRDLTSRVIDAAHEGHRDTLIE